MNARLQLQETPDRFVSSPTLRRILLERIDRITGFQGARVLYFDGINMVTIRPYPAICQSTYLTLVLRKLNAQEATRLATGSPPDQGRASRFITELAGTAIGCSAAILSWTVVAGSGTAIPITGGASSFITALGWGSATASSAQCLVSGARLINESGLGNRGFNDWLDSQEWYGHTMTALDALSLMGATASIGATLKMVLQLRKAGATSKAALTGLSRQQRKRITEEVIRANVPGISNSHMKAMIAAGVYPKRFASYEINSTVRRQLKDAIGAALGFSGSATGGIVRDPRRIDSFAVAVMEEFETF